MAGRWESQRVLQSGLLSGGNCLPHVELLQCIPEVEFREDLAEIGAAYAEGGVAAQQVQVGAIGRPVAGVVGSPRVILGTRRTCANS